MKYADENEKKKVLPKAVGGSKVPLLLGIKNTRIQPVLMKVLPSGVGVYLSPFRDVNGSRIIYAGRSKWFTRTDNDCTQNSNYAIYSVFGTNIRDKVDNELNNDCLNKGRINDNVVQQSPGANLIKISDNELETDCLKEGRIVDNVVQRSPCVKMIVCKNDFEKSLFSEPGLEPDLIEFRDTSITELEYMMIPTDCENGFESMHLS